MNTLRNRFVLGLYIVMLACVGGSGVHAAGSVQIVGVSPLGAINAGTMVNFSTVATGFTDPVYAVSDSFSASGSTVGTIDKIGYFTWTPGIYDAGTHTITVTVSDASGDSGTASVNILIASHAIILNSLSPGPIVAVHRPLTFTVVAPGFTNPRYAIYDSNQRTSVSSANINTSGAFSWAPTLDDVGIHSITVWASDFYGNSAQVIQNITVINPLVTITSLTPSSAARVGSPVSFTASTDLFATSTYSVSDSFMGTSTVATQATISSAGKFLWTPVASDIGFHAITVTATDAYGNAASSTMTFPVLAAAPAAPSTASTPAPSTAGTNTPSAVASGTSQKYLFTTYLAIGSRGTAVTELQNRLTALGLYTGPVTGYFGALTSASVKKLQAAHNLSQVGFVGPATRAALNSGS